MSLYPNYYFNLDQVLDEIGVQLEVQLVVTRSPGTLQDIKALTRATAFEGKT